MTAERYEQQIGTAMLKGYVAVNLKELEYDE